MRTTNDARPRTERPSFVRPDRQTVAPRGRSRPRHHLGVLACAACALALLPGCLAWRTGGHADARLVSAEFPVDVVPDLPIRAYVPLTESSADIYLTDLDDQALTRALTDPTAQVTGTIVHAHLFVQPSPGKTPIAETAFSATVRYVIFSRGTIGVYDGGGFCLPRGRPGDDHFAGSIPEATLRINRTTPGFIDRIGRGTLRVAFRAERNRDRVERLSRLTERAVRTATPIDDASTPPDDLLP
jgi:hypothetical protein